MYNDFRFLGVQKFRNSEVQEFKSKKNEQVYFTSLGNAISKIAAKNDYLRTSYSQSQKCAIK